MLIAAALAVLLTWAVIGVALIGIGSLLLGRFEKDVLLLDALWLGLALSVALLQLWSFLWPINSTAAIVIVCLGAVGFLENRTVLFLRLKTALREARWSTVFYFAILVLLALRASGPCDYYDTGLYGAPAVRWIQTYPVVPGLANVHGRLGFNSSVFLCITALNHGFWKGLAFHLFTGFLIAATWFTILPACYRLILRSSSSSADWFYSILALPMGLWAVRGKIVGTLTDEPTTIVCLVAAGILFEELQRKEPQSSCSPRLARLVVAASLFALAVTFKQTAAVFGFLAWCLAFRWIWSGPQTTKRRLYALAVVGLSAIIILPWCARGVLSSGYPFFPATALGFPVDWKVPSSMAHWYFAGAQSWARMPDVELADTRGLAWIRPWLNQAIRDRGSFQVPLFISLAGLAVALGLRWRKKGSALGPPLGLMIPGLVGIIFWLASAPGLRFGQPAIWTTAGTLGTWGIVSLASDSYRENLTKVVLAALAALLIWCLISFGWKEPYQRLLGSPPLAPLPESGVTTRQTKSGLIVYLPVEGNQCWDAPLPCTPYFDETLRLRNPASLRSGFQSNAEEKVLPRFQIGQP